MRSLLCFFVLGFAFVACHPGERCSGELYYDGRNCRACPDDAEFRDGRCVCEDDERYRFTGGRCQLRPGAEPEPAPDAGMASCGSYCEFATGCVGGNSLATSALPDVVMGLHADDAAECERACKDDSDADGGDEVLACFHAGRIEADCEDDGTQAGIERAFGLVSACCAGETAPLCVAICETLKANAFVAPMIDFCD